MYEIDTEVDQVDEVIMFFLFININKYVITRSNISSCDSDLLILISAIDSYWLRFLLHVMFSFFSFLKICILIDVLDL